MSDPKRLIHLNPAGRLQRTVEGDIVNIGGTVSQTFTVNGKGLLYDDGSSTSSGSPGSGIGTLTLQAAYNNQHDINDDAIIQLNTGQDIGFKAVNNITSLVINADTGNITIGGLVNGISFDSLVDHLTPSIVSKHTASEISITPIAIDPTATNVQQVLDNLTSTIIEVSGNAGYGMEHIQTTPAHTWTIIHNRNTKRIHWSIWDDNDEMVMPDSVKLINTNTLEVYFGVAQTGRCVLMSF